VCNELRRAGGTAQLVKALARGVPVLFNSPAARVHYGARGVTVVTTQGRAITADACIVTVPLGVLKAGKIDFCPPLPKAKVRAIKRLGCDLTARCRRAMQLRNRE
jgi:polyamine oxidase